MTAFLYIALAVALAAAITDLRTGHMPNPLTLGALGGALVLHLGHGAYVGGFAGALEEGGRALLGALACSVVPLFLFVKGGIGGGDVKLFAALGALTLPLAGLEAQTYAFVAALVVAPARLAFDGVLLRTLKNTAVLVANPFRPEKSRAPIPPEMQSWFRLGPCIFLGMLAAAFAHGAGQ
jgi:prepilin peptidase CpaA